VNEDISSININVLTTRSSQPPNISLSTMMQSWIACCSLQVQQRTGTQSHCLNLLDYVTMHLKWKVKLWWWLYKLKEL